MTPSRSRILHHLLSVEARNDASTRELAVTTLYKEGLLEAYESGISRAPYKLTAKGKAEAVKVGKAEPDDAALRRYFLEAIQLAAGKKLGPWFHDVEHESMLDDGLLEVAGDSAKRYAPFRLSAKGIEAIAPKGGAA